jgi:hypothetical protein
MFSPDPIRLRQRSAAGKFFLKKIAGAAVFSIENQKKWRYINRSILKTVYSDQKPFSG